MGTEMTLEEVERRIRIVEDNLRELMEQAAAFSGAADEERAAARIADQLSPGIGANIASMIIKDFNSSPI